MILLPPGSKRPDTLLPDTTLFRSGYAEGQVYNIYFRERAARPARAADAVRAVFSRGGACYDCHTVTPPAAGQGWQVEAVHQTPRFLGKGWFDHDAHKETACADCHTTAPRSKQASDLPVPGLSQCRDCHDRASGGRPGQVARKGGGGGKEW